MNKAVIAALEHQPEAAGGPHDILWAEEGPLWYRGAWRSTTRRLKRERRGSAGPFQSAPHCDRHTKQYTMVNARFDGA